MHDLGTWHVLGLDSMTVPNIAPFLTTYWHHILAAVVCFLLGIAFKTVNQPQGVRGPDKRRDSSVNYPAPEPHDDENCPHVPYSLPGFDGREMVRRSDNFYSEMSSRRSVRDISNRPVPVEVIQNCIKTAGTSPSGAHMQPWTFVAISNPELKLEVRHIIEEEEKINYEKRMSEQWLQDIKRISTTWCKPYLTHAPYVIIVFKKQFALTQEGKRKTNYYQEISASIATGFLLIALHNAGLVTVTTTPMNAGPRLRVLMDRPVGEKVLVLLPVGYPTDGAMVPDLTRKALSEIMVLKD